MPSAHPNEPNRFGWVVEIDPHDPQAPPVKRTALGRMAHEGAACSVGPDGRLAFYMADDWEFEYVYKFVTARPAIPPAARPIAICSTTGTLYAARFNADGSGDWLPLVHGQGPLTAANGFADQGEVLVKTRQAADALGATSMDRPEWIVPHPVTRDVYCACTGNTTRGRERQRGAESRQSARAQSVRPPPALARGRRRSRGHALSVGRLRARRAPSRQGGHHHGRLVRLSGRAVDRRHAARCGWRRTCRPAISARATSPRSATISSWPWIPPAGVFKRFLTGPRGCEITGFHTTPDNRTAFVNIQHPGEVAGDRSNPDASARAVELARLPVGRAPALGHRGHPSPRRRRRGT